MPPQVPFWDPQYEGETFTGPEDTGMRAQDFWYFLTHDGDDGGDDDTPLVSVNVTPRRYTQATHAMWDQSMGLDYLFPPELDLSESMEGVWETERSWQETDTRMRQAGFRPIPEHYTQRWFIAPELLRPPEQSFTARLNFPDRVNTVADTATRNKIIKPEPPVERKSAWERLLNDDDED